MTSSMTRPDAVGSERPRFDTMPGRHAAGEPERVAEGDDELPDPKLGCVAERHRRRHRSAGAQHREVGEHVASDDVDRDGGAVAERRLRRTRPGHHVRAREQHAVVGDDARAPGATTARRSHRKARDARQHGACDSRHDSRVRVERIFGGHTEIMTPQRRRAPGVRRRRNSVSRPWFRPLPLSGRMPLRMPRLQLRQAPRPRRARAPPRRAPADTRGTPRIRRTRPTRRRRTRSAS